jgi:protein ImuB
MVALSHPAVPAGSLSVETPETGYRQARALWLALELLDPSPVPAMLESLARFAQCLTSVVVLRPNEGLLLEVRGSLKYFCGLSAIKNRLTAELEQRGWTGRLATAPTPLAASWLVRHVSVDIVDESALAGALGRLPLAATTWPESVQLMLGQMGLRTIADCIRLPRAGFARRIGQVRLDDLDRALGRKPDFRDACETPQRLFRVVEFAAETSDRTAFAEALSGIAAAFEQKLRQCQMQVREVTLGFRHLRCEATETHMRFVDPVHERARILGPLLARIERIPLREPAIALSLTTGALLPLEADAPGLLPLADADGKAVPEYALVECLRGRFGARRVYGIDWVAEHRPEHAWRAWTDRPAAGLKPGPPCPSHGRPLWLLPKPRRTGGQTHGSDPLPAQRGLSEPATPLLHPDGAAPPERIESGWWDGRDVRRDYHIVVGPAGEKLWLYRDCLTRQWYLHGIFG